MKITAQLAAVVPLLHLANSLDLLAPRSSPTVISASIQRKTTTNLSPATRDRLRVSARASASPSTLSESLSNDITLYFANVTLGTPPQPLALHLDTGSSDLWVNTPSSALCTRYASVCAASGSYTANASSSYRYLNSRFNITYIDRSGATGDYATDQLSIGGVELPAFQFGIGYRSTSQEGILGIGYPANEVAVNAAGGGSAYPNLPKALQNRGVIASSAFSLWLNDLDASTGSVLFGGVDTAKFHGTLQTLPVIAQYGEYAEFIIALTALGVNGVANSLAAGVAIPVLLDSGSSLTYLPASYVDTLFTQWNAVYDAQEGAAIVPCSLAEQQGSVDFTFSSAAATISVPLNELVLVGGYTDGQPVCIFGVAPLAAGSTAVLGDTFLRSAYVVYDIANNQISLAPTNFNSTADDIVEIASGAGGVPSATPVQNAVTSVGTRLATGVAVGGGSTVALAATPNAAVPRVAKAMITSGPGVAAAAVLGWGAVLAL